MGGIEYKGDSQEAIEGDYLEAERIVDDAIREEADIEGEFQPMGGQPEAVELTELDRAKGFVRLLFGGLGYLLKFKDPRLEWGDEIKDQAAETIAPAMVKHNLTGGPVGAYQEEIQAAGFLGMLGFQTVGKIHEFRAQDMAEAKAAREAQAQAGAVNGI